MFFKITGVDWQSFLNDKNRPIVIGIEDLLVSVMINYRQKNEQGWLVFMQILHVATRPVDKKGLELVPGCILKGVVCEDASETKEDRYGFLEKQA
jgi:hypothetical protein